MFISKSLVSSEPQHRPDAAVDTPAGAGEAAYRTQQRKTVHSVHTRLILKVHENGLKTSSFFCEENYILLHRLLNAVSLELMYGVHEQGCGISKCIRVLGRRSSASAEHTQYQQRTQKPGPASATCVIYASVPASIFALISLLLVISERGLQFACQAVPVLVCCAAGLMPYYFLRKEAW